MTQATLLLGTNIGNRWQNMVTAAQLVDQYIGKVVQKSSMYQTAAWGVEDQQDFLNQVIVVDTELEAPDILTKIATIEKEMGRERYQKWGPRLIDVDILFMGNEVIDTNELKVPHPEIQNRRFTLAPLYELMPDFVHPVLGKTISELLEETPDKLPIELFKNE